METTVNGKNGAPVRPRIVCLCGSSRFCDLAAVYAWLLEKRGIMAVGMHLLPQWYWDETRKVGNDHAAEQEGVAGILDELHLRKIDMADAVVVVNAPLPGREDGYIGERTGIEIEYAKRIGKLVHYAPSIEALERLVFVPEREKIHAMLVEVARAACFLADDTEESDAGCTCDTKDYKRLCEALDALDDLPDPPNEAATGLRKAEYWLLAGR